MSTTAIMIGTANNTSTNTAPAVAPLVIADIIIINYNVQE